MPTHEEHELVERCRRVLESNLLGILFWHREGAITYANDALLRMTGYDREALRQGRMRWRDMTPAEHRERDEIALREMEVKGHSTAYEKEYIRRDGTRVPILIYAALFDGSRDAGIAFVLDLTERRRLEQRLLAAQRMEVLGQLAGGIAHDFNNLLSAITGYAVAAISKLRKAEDVREELAGVLATAQRAAVVTRQLLTFARQEQVAPPRDIPVNEVLNGLDRILRMLVDETIELVMFLDPDAGSVHIDRGQLEQVITNLVVNARDAMPGGGRIVVRTGLLHLDEEAVRWRPELAVGNYVLLSVTDNGTGMSEDVRSRVFEPFFTTKPLGVGTGLGLSICYGIVKKARGDIAVTSAPGVGTTFEILLPHVSGRFG